MKHLIFIVMTLFTMTSCSHEQERTLILYYSQTGATRTVAEELQKQTGAALAAFDVTDPYTGDFNQTIQRCQAEQAANSIPTLAPLSCNLAAYDTIFLGYPIWFGTYAPPVKALLASENLNGKVIVPFCTFGSGGLQASAADLKAALPGAEIREGYGVRNARLAAAPEELNRFLIEQGYIQGEVEALQPFSAPQPVSDDEAAVFDAACGSYQFPLGTPVTVGSRPVANGTDYVFTAASSGADSTRTESTVYVSVRKGQAPEFLQVIR